MAFEQSNQSPHRPQAPNDQNSSDVSLPPIASEEWEYNRYNSAPMNNRPYPPATYPNHPPPQLPPRQQQQQQQQQPHSPQDYAARDSYASAYPPSSWEQVIPHCLSYHRNYE